MIHVLKYAILGITNISIYNNILNQMQILFANLKLSEKRYYDPDNLCRTKIFNNEPINVTIQQDSKEFYDSVCDSLENCLKDTKYKNI
jgi:ubiquitin carboxyl-terminal hydrolase 9/24